MSQLRRFPCNKPEMHHCPQILHSDISPLTHDLHYNPPTGSTTHHHLPKTNPQSNQSPTRSHPYCNLPHGATHTPLFLFPRKRIPTPKSRPKRTRQGSKIPTQRATTSSDPHHPQRTTPIHHSPLPSQEAHTPPLPHLFISLSSSLQIPS